MDTLRSCGAEVVDCDLEWHGPCIQVGSSNEKEDGSLALLYEFKAQLDAHLSKYAGGSGRMLEQKYWAARFDTIENGMASFDRIMEEKKLDLFVAPTYHGLASKTGYPVLIVPMGKTQSGMPAGMAFFAGRFSEQVLFRAAYAYEQASRRRSLPELP